MKLKKFSLNYGSQVLKALSDEARIRILYLLYRNSDMCISDLELILDFTQTKTSRHITYLKNSGIVFSRKMDQWVFYSIKEEAFDFIEQIFTYMDKDVQLTSDQETFETLYSNRELAKNKLDSKKWSL